MAQNQRSKCHKNRHSLALILRTAFNEFYFRKKEKEEKEKEKKEKKKSSNQSSSGASAKPDESLKVRVLKRNKVGLGRSFSNFNIRPDTGYPADF